MQNMEDHLRTIPQAVSHTFLQSAISQTFSGLYWLEKFLAQYPPGSILELGTGPGVLSCLFGMHCPDHVVTCDLHEGPGGLVGEVFKRLGVRYCKQDVLNAEFAVNVVTQLHEEAERCFVFCDNGNKQVEFAMYAPLLKTGDTIAVHDFGVEFHVTTEVDAIIATCNLERRYLDCVDDGSLLAFWIKRM